MLSKKLFCSLRKVPNRMTPRNTCGRFTSVLGSHVFSLSQNRAMRKQRLRQNGQRSHERSESQNCEATWSKAWHAAEPDLAMGPPPASTTVSLRSTRFLWGEFHSTASGDAVAQR